MTAVSYTHLDVYKRQAADHVAQYRDILISIHAPREGRDGIAVLPCFSASEFQSTRPARGATLTVNLWYYTESISIHAPREGRDLSHR